MAGQPKAPFYIAVALVVAGLVGFAIYRADIFAPKAPGPGGNGSGNGAANGGGMTMETATEADTGTVQTTFKEYAFVPSQRLPPVKGTSAYQPLEDNTVRFALNVWAGWGPIILANEGFKAGKVWKAPDGSEFKVELVLIDDPVAMRDAYVGGQIHIGWGTLDMVPLFMEGFVAANDSRIMPRIYQQVDWSNGGDGIVVRSDIKTVADLRGKTVTLAENSPSHYFLLNMLAASNMQYSEINTAPTATAFEAAAAFNTNDDIAAAVSWAPDIYKLAEARGNRMLVTTASANKLIADIWFARADFAKDHPQIIEGLVRGIFDGMAELKNDARKQQCAQLMAEGYSIPATDALAMFADAHSTNWKENEAFFIDSNNPTNFEQVWRNAYRLYRNAGSISHQPVKFDQVMDFSIIQKLGKEEKYANQKDEYRTSIAARSTEEIRAESDQILTNTVVINFYPNSWDLKKTVLREVDGQSTESLYDPNVDFVIDEIGRLAGQFSNARIIIEGHTDSSMQGQIPETMATELSQHRANAVKDAVLVKFPDLEKERFNIQGEGWKVPADPEDPKNHTKNRRVEVKVYTTEAVPQS